ncbi:hypothetical protein HELRODRAFT_168275 [Helobdella robusta]|uniref:Reverse transcriptase domain-containing protein n=1 Tax=Helobdella robusta TaxID=6412 RepID=T1F0E0_HELRO|nr:hypothetical protein HELRODRAFT_168275 [Helobdella robusta]ESO09311.1 hypothetical protein HELRODRAFT_168275 [Helobdella robusta]
MITVEELKYAIDTSNNSTPGPDKITYNMIKHLPNTSLVSAILFTNNKMLPFFFDVEKAYDKAWRYGILRDLFRAGLKEQEMEMGIPQGSILSVTLFCLKINGLCNIIPPDMLGCLYSLYR